MLAALLAATALPARAQLAAPQLSADESAFQAISALYQTSADRAAVIEAFRQFLKKYPKSQRAADALFMTGEAHMSKALELLHQEKISKRGPAAGPAGAKPGSMAEFNSAAEIYGSVAGRYSGSGLEASALYRAGEAYYNMGDWEQAVKEFSKVESDYPKSYIAPESLLGQVYSNIALNRRRNAQNIFFHFGEIYLAYASDPALVFAGGIIELSRKNYPASQKLFSRLDTPQARFFLGKAYLYEGRTDMAASVFGKLLKNYPGFDSIEEAEFLICESFFYARDFDGAISKYQDFIKNYPGSKLKTAAVFRIGVSQLNRKDYLNARLNFRAVTDKSPFNYFAPYSWYFIGESYLANKQTGDALSAYAKITAGYPTSSAAPASFYKLAWCRYLLGDYQGALQTLGNFIGLYPAHALAKNAYYLMGAANLALKKPQEALGNFQSAVDLAPSSEVAEQALFMILRTEYARGDYNSILTSYQVQSIFKNPPPAGSKWRALSLLYVAEAYLARNLFDDAKNIYNTAARLSPDKVSLLYAQEGLVWCYALSGDSSGAAKAREKLKTARAAFPDAGALSGTDALSVADSYFNAKDFKKAFGLYDAFASDNASSKYAPAALYKAGLALYRLHYYTQAVETWDKLARKYPGTPETETAELQSADTWFRAQKYAEAVTAYNGIIARYPKNKQLALAYLRLAQIDYNRKEDAKAVEQLKTVVTLWPDVPEAADAFDLMEAAFDRTAGLDFKAELGALAAREPKDRTSGEALFRLGRRLFEKKDYALSAENLKKFSVDYVDHPSIKDAQFYLGEAYFQTGDMQNAAEVFERFAVNYPDAKEHPVALFRLGSAYYNLKNYEPASKAYAKLAELYPASEYTQPALFNLALCYKNTGLSGPAEETYRRYYNLAGSSGDALSALWEIFKLQKDRGDVSAAVKTLTEIYGQASGREDSLEALYRMGELYSDNKQPEEALDYWGRLVLQKPYSSPWRLQGLIKIGEIYEAEKNYPEAARVYDDISKNSADPETAKAAAEKARSLLKMSAIPQASDADDVVSSVTNPAEGAGSPLTVTTTAPAAGAGADETTPKAGEEAAPVQTASPAVKKKKKTVKPVKAAKKRPAVAKSSSTEAGQ